MADAVPTAQSTPTDIPDPYPSLDLLKSLAGLLTFILAVCFGIGLLVTNFYLVTIGVSDFDLLKARCILTGAWACLLLFILSIPSFVLLRISRAPAGHDLRKSAKGEILRVISLGLSLAIMLGAILRGIPPNFEMLPLYCICMALITLPAVYNIWFETTARKNLPDSMASRLRDAKVRTTVFAAITTVGAIFFLSQVFYPSVLPIFGGGKPQKAHLVLTDEGVSTWKRILQAAGTDGAAKQPVGGPSLEPVPALTPEIEILYENEARLVVRLKPNDKMVIAVIDRKLLSAIIPSEYRR
jgi:hypothetical protein